MAEGGVPAAAAAVRGVERDATNSFANYRYASKDAVYGAVRDALAAQGLAVWMHEAEREIVRSGKDGDRAWLICGFDIALTQGGEAPADGAAERVSAGVPLSSPQDFGKVRSYALKSYLIGKLLIPTGDRSEDMDAVDPDGGAAPPPETPPARTVSLQSRPTAAAGPLKGKPAKMPSGDWGCQLDPGVRGQAGAEVTLVSKDGKTWTKHLLSFVGESQYGARWTVADNPPAAGAPEGAAEGDWQDVPF